MQEPLTDPDSKARADRQLLRDRLHSISGAKGRPRNAETSGPTWLERARSRFGLRAVADSAVGAIDRRQDLLRTFLELTRTDESEAISRLLSSLPSTANSGESSEQFNLGVRLLAQAKLGTLDDKQFAEHLLKDGAERQIWWRDTATALTRTWITSGRPTGWISALAKRDPALLRTAALDSDEGYERVRSELLRVGGQGGEGLLLAFASREQEQRQGKAYRDLLGELKTRIGSSVVPAAPDTPSDLASPLFYLRFGMSADGLATSAIRELLDLARRALGNSPSHFHAEVQYWLAQDNLLSAEDECKHWQAEHPSDGDGDAWFWQGRVCARGKRFSDALDCYRESVTLADDKDDAQLLSFP